MKKQGLLTELWRARMVRIWAVSVAVLFVTAWAVFVIVRPREKNTTSIPHAIIEVADFTPYFYKEPIPAGFEVNKGSVNLTRGVLYARMTDNKNQGVTLTEQKLPADLLHSSLGGEKVEGARGTAVIYFNQGRTTATLLTEDGKTMVLIDTTDQVGSEAIKDLLKALRPLR